MQSGKGRNRRSQGSRTWKSNLIWYNAIHKLIYSIGKIWSLNFEIFFMFVHKRRFKIMYTPEIDHAESENRTISACPRKLTSVQHFFITDNRPTFWTVHGSCSWREMRKRKSFEGKNNSWNRSDWKIEMFDAWWDSFAYIRSGD